MRINGKEQIINYENSIQKSNDFSFAKLSHKLSLNQLQLLAFTVFCTQKNGKTEFNKADFEKQFNLGEYRTQYAYNDVEALTELKVKMKYLDLEKDKFRFKQYLIFREIEYDQGLFSFQWDSEIIPHILDLKERFINLDLSIADKFKSEFSWILYDYLKSLHGYWYVTLTKDELMKLFKVQDKKTYIQNTGKLKQSVIDVAVEEINEHTELEIHYKDEKQGRKIIGFTIYWSSGKKIAGATNKQINELKRVIDIILEDSLLFINLSEDKNRQRAIEIIRETEGMRLYTNETNGITKDYASQLIRQANDKLRMLVTMYEKENNGRDLSVYYDWLNAE